MPMSQKERDRYNLQRGGAAGLPYVIKKGQTAADAATAFANPQTVQKPIEFTPQGFMNEYQRAYGEAKAANEARYADILGNLNDRYTRNMGYVNDIGTQGMADINTGAQQQNASIQQQMTNSGLAGTTVMPTMQAGVERSRIANQNRLRDSLAQQKIATDSALSGDIASFKERRDDPYPDMGTYAQLAMQLGAGGYGYGGGGPGGVGGGGGGGFGGGGGGGFGGGGGINLPWGTVAENKIGPAGASLSGGYWTQRPLTGAEKESLMQGGFVSGYNGMSYKQMLANAKAGIDSGTGRMIGMSVGPATGAGAATKYNIAKRNYDTGSAAIYGSAPYSAVPNQGPNAAGLVPNTPGKWHPSVLPKYGMPVTQTPAGYGKSRALMYARR